MDSPSAAPAPRAVTVKDAYWFFLPLIFMSNMMMISHSIIYGFLARLPDPKLTLAAYNVAFSFHSVAGSPVWTAVMTGLAFISDRRSVHRLLQFNLIIAAVITATGYVMGLTPLGDVVFGDVIGASPEVVQGAKHALLLFMLIPPISIFRSLSYALLMRNRLTIVITIGTFLRLVSLAGYLLVLPHFLHGASVGAAALFLCIATESVLAMILAYRFYFALPHAAGGETRMREFWRFSWPLMLVQASENGVAFTINFFLGRLAAPDLALAAFGVMDGLWKLLLSPLRNLAQTAQTLVRTREELHTVFRFVVQVVAGFIAVAALFYVPQIRTWVLEGALGLTAEIANTIAPALLLFVVLAFVLGFSAFTRGLLLSARVTGPIAKAAGVRLAVVIAVGSFSLLHPHLNGALLGVLALIGGFGSEMLVLGWRVLRPAVDNPYSPLPPALRDDRTA